MRRKPSDVQEVQTLQLLEGIHYLAGPPQVLLEPPQVLQELLGRWTGLKNPAEGPWRSAPTGDLSPQLQLPGRQVSGAVTTNRNKGALPSLTCWLTIRLVGQVGSVTRPPVQVRRHVHLPTGESAQQDKASASLGSGSRAGEGLPRWSSLTQSALRYGL